MTRIAHSSLTSTSPSPLTVRPSTSFCPERKTQRSTLVTGSVGGVLDHIPALLVGRIRADWRRVIQAHA